jgi:hypothetical protein
MSQGQSLRSARTNSRTSCGFCDGTYRQPRSQCYDAVTGLPAGQLGTSHIKINPARHGTRPST